MAKKLTLFLFNSFDIDIVVDTDVIDCMNHNLIHIIHTSI